MKLSTDDFMTVREVALCLRLNPLTIYEYIKQGKIPAARFGRYYRIPRIDLKRFIQRQKVKYEI